METVLGERLEGPNGWAQHVTVPGHPMAPTSCAQWFMCLPDQGIGYDKFILSAVSLASMPGIPEPKLRYPEAEYEVHVMALSPDCNPRLDDSDTWRPLIPGNFVRQFHGVTHGQAAEFAGHLAYGCVQGKLPAETQTYVDLSGQDPKMMYIKEVLDLWDSAVDQLIEHVHTGGLHERAN